MCTLKCFFFSFLQARGLRRAGRLALGSPQACQKNSTHLRLVLFYWEERKNATEGSKRENDFADTAKHPGGKK